MITVVSNPSGFHVVTALKKALKFAAHSNTTEILQGIKDWPEDQGVDSLEN
jgi:hypothetical protein